MNTTFSRVLIGTAVILAAALSPVTVRHQAIAQGHGAHRASTKVADGAADNTSVKILSTSGRKKSPSAPRQTV
jgi:hypothetical protein